MDHPSTVLVSPTGTRILGTLERITGRALIVPGSARLQSIGRLEFEYEGSTELDWNSQETVVRDNERIFVDDEGNEFVESDLRLVPNPEAAP